MCEIVQYMYAMTSRFGDYMNLIHLFLSADIAGLCLPLNTCVLYM